MYQRKIKLIIILLLIFIPIFFIKNYQTNIDIFSLKDLQYDDYKNIKSSSSAEEYYIFDWAKEIGTYHGGVAIDSENNVYFGGDKGQNYYIEKFYENGTSIWSRTINIILIDWGKDIVVDSEDNVYITGWCTASQTEGGGYIVTRKYNSTGDFQWDRTFGTDGRAFDITVDNDNNVYIVGYTAEFGASSQDKDTVIIKYDSSGILEWYRRSHISGNDCGYGVAFNSFNSMIYITGESSGDIILLMYNKNGVLILSNQWDNGGSESVCDICVNPSLGNVFIVGSLGYTCVIFDSMCNNILNISGPSQNAITLDSIGNLFVSRSELQDIFFSKYSFNGEKLWEILAPPINGYDWPIRMVRDLKNNIYMSVFYWGFYKFCIDRIAPQININSPNPYEVFGKIRPDFDLEINDPNLQSIWYSLINDSISTDNYTWEGQMHQKVWEQVGNGNITINFYANDSNGNLGFNHTTITKDLNLNFYWNLTQNPIYIDDSTFEYSWAKVERDNAWCYGSGTIEDPYMLENIFIDGRGSGNCILIQNSERPFGIKNCTLIKAGSGYWDAGIKLSNTSNGIIENCTCLGNGYYGIYLELQSNNNSIIYSNFEDNNCGIHMRYSHFNEFSNNHLSNNNNKGIFLRSCHNQTITRNTVKDSYEGLFIDRCYDSIASSNTFDTCSAGVKVEYFYNNEIIHNIISNCSWCGLYLYNTDNNTVENNLISKNKYGIIIDTYQIQENNIIKGNLISYNEDYGIFIKDKNCKNNLIYNNSFIGNTINAFDKGTNNIWNNGILGNYWDDYNGKDKNDDGIGDIPHIFEENSQDNNPIWWDGPKILIKKPIDNQTIGIDSPEFEVIIEEGIADSLWYTLNNESTKYMFTSNGSINQAIWETFDNESFITIKFFVNDSKGLSNFNTVCVIKIITSQTPNPPSPDPPPPDENSEISSILGFNIFFLVCLLILIPMIIIRIRKRILQIK